MPVTVSEVRPGAYYDSVILMHLQRSLRELEGVIDAGVVMATPANKELLSANGLLTEDEAGPDDLLVVITAEKEEIGRQAIARIEELIAARRSVVPQEFRPHSLSAALQQLPQANWVSVSVPGRFAAGVTQDALELGLHVFLYSDNVSLEDEVRLKKTAQDAGLLLMGPDCGTAIIDGIGFGFANQVRQGNIGLVGASGTGLQAITSRIHELGAGVSHALGTGGRDLKTEVGAITARQALDLLVRDEDTKVIVLVAKLPAPVVATTLLAAARRINKPVVVNFIGNTEPLERIGNIYFARGLNDTAELAVELANNEDLFTGSRRERGQLSPGYMRGLFSGGTLAIETLFAMQAIIAPIYSNISTGLAKPLVDVNHSQGHTVLDLGDDIFTQGRLHPMMDNDLRIRRLRQEAADLEVSLILLDVVLGRGAHQNPASELAPEIENILQKAQDSGRSLLIVVLVLGTDEDPQGLESQMSQFESAGAVVFDYPAEAIGYVVENVRTEVTGAGEPVNLSAIRGPLSAINVGLEVFYESLSSQGAQLLQLDWRPPAGGKEDLVALLAKMKSTGG